MRSEQEMWAGLTSTFDIAKRRPFIDSVRRRPMEATRDERDDSLSTPPPLHNTLCPSEKTVEDSKDEEPDACSEDSAGRGRGPLLEPKGVTEGYEV